MYYRLYSKISVITLTSFPEKVIYLLQIDSKNLITSLLSVLAMDVTGYIPETASLAYNMETPTGYYGPSPMRSSEPTQ